MKLWPQKEVIKQVRTNPPPQQPEYSSMASDRDSDEENLEFDDNSDVEDEIDESILDAIEGDLAAEEAASEEVCTYENNLVQKMVFILFGNHLGNCRR